MQRPRVDCDGDHAGGQVMSLLCDIESFIAFTDLTESAFERQAKCTGLLSRLRNGASPRAKTEMRIREWMELQISSEKNQHD